MGEGVDGWGLNWKQISRMINKREEKAKVSAIDLGDSGAMYI